MKKIDFSRKRIAAALSFFITVIFIWFSLNPPKIAETLLKRLEYIAYDMRLNLLIQPKAAPKNPIVIVDIDEKSLKAEGRWPWPRKKLSALLEALYQQQVTVIAFDMLFPEAEDTHDQLFSTVLSQEKNKNILGIYFSGQANPAVGDLPPPAVILNERDKNLWLPDMQSYIANTALLQQAAGHAGVISVIPDEDGVIRHYSLLQRYQHKLYPSLALEAVRLYLLENQISLRTEKTGHFQSIAAIKLGAQAIPTDAQGHIFIPYLGKSKTFPYYSATDILHHRLPAQQLQNAIVFVGTSAIGLSDLRSTPVENVYPGVEVHATMAEALLMHHFSYVPDWMPGAQLVLLSILGIILSAVFVWLGPLWIILISILASLSVFFGSLALWKTTDIIFPITLPILLVLSLAAFHMTYGFLTESRRRDELKKVFAQYVPAERVAEIMKHPEAANVFEGERKEMSVLFMDIRNFTTLSEKLSLADLKKLLNFFLTEMTRVIFNHGGTVDKYVGDMIMAFWGAPLPDSEHAKHALTAGLEMLSHVQRLEAKFREMKLPVLRIGIGVNTGIMNVGDMGSTYRRAYTVLGDAVNLASRLESLSKYYGVNMICGEEAIKGQDEFIFRLLDKVRVKGKQTGVSIYEPYGLRAVLPAEKLAELQQYHTALESYFEQDWLTAQKLFLRLQQNYPEIILYKIYLNRIAQFMMQPPASAWDGVWVHQEK